MTTKVSDAHACLNNIEAFVRVRCTRGFAEEPPLRLKAQMQAREVGDAWAEDPSPDGLAAMQRACMLKDLLTTFGSCERITDWASTCLSHVAELRVLLTRCEPARRR